MTSKPHHSNLAARMGRWSAAHWKKATFGWLAFVVLAFGLGGLVGTKNIDTNAGAGQSGRVDKILDAGFKQPAARERPDREPLRSGRRRRLRRSDRRRDRRGLEAAGGAAGPPRRDLREPACRARRLPDPR